jgi:electron transfer flavoprotein beta subunit
VKQVPDTEARIRIAPDGKGIAEGDVNWIVSPYDEFAIEEALRIKEKKGGGGRPGRPRHRPRAVRAAQRPGHGRGFRPPSQGPALRDLDTLGTAWALARPSAPRPDLVLTGQQGVGGDNSQIPGCWPRSSTCPR